MNFGSLALKALVVVALLFLLSLAGAVRFPALTNVTSGGVGIAGILFLIIAMLILSVIGNLMGRGIRSVKKPPEVLFLSFVGAFFMGAVLALFAILNVPSVPSIASINLNWLGTAWYSPFLALLFIGTPLILVFLVTD